MRPSKMVLVCGLSAQLRGAYHPALPVQAAGMHRQGRPLQNLDIGCGPHHQAVGFMSEGRSADL
ncbi:TPA: hypothetical protein I3789_004677 [Enterobacter cloacae]|uniref:hypothetical protein n=1 Tax=Enterobacter cloacae TaxID=550 RepID=UPI001140C77D|nr:hypothetical protein [Enterobacter cloacae]HAS1065182.1 hypothetical protein [Enterobacter cloacae]HAS1098093.1 hypothetical protein [Enterobacter cloacae]